MPAWTVFGGVAVVLAVSFVLLARASARTLQAAFEAAGESTVARGPTAGLLESNRLLLGNVLASHGLLLGILLATAWVAGIPFEVAGIVPVSASDVAVGLALGVVLAVGNEASARLADRVGLDHDERLRTLLAPESLAGWLTLLVVVLPLIAIAEELLFRGVLIGGLAAGFGLPVWGLVLASSVLFGLGHGLQGQAGVVVTTGLGAVLAVAFVLTGSLTVVGIAHYLVNALEFLVHEWRDDPW